MFKTRFSIWDRQIGQLGFLFTQLFKQDIWKEWLHRVMAIISPIFSKQIEQVVCSLIFILVFKEAELFVRLTNFIEYFSVYYFLLRRFWIHFWFIKSHLALMYEVNQKNNEQSPCNPHECYSNIPLKLGWSFFSH